MSIEQTRAHYEAMAVEAAAINDGGPAFPIPNLHHDEDFNGMTLRDYFAAKALPAVIAQCAQDTRRRLLRPNLLRDGRRHAASPRGEGMNAPTQRVDVLAILRENAREMELEGQRVWARVCEACADAAADLIAFIREANCKCLSENERYAAHTCRRCELLARLTP